MLSKDLRFIRLTKALLVLIRWMQAGHRLEDRAGLLDILREEPSMRVDKSIENGVIG